MCNVRRQRVGFIVQGEVAAAIICAATLAMQFAGLSVLGRVPWRRGRSLHFDIAKPAVAPGGKGAGRVLKDPTSRDFYCFVFMLASLGGVLGLAITVFLAGSAVWLAFVIRTEAQRGIPA